jgi:hypothetical protein
VLAKEGAATGACESSTRRLVEEKGVVFLCLCLLPMVKAKEGQHIETGNVYARAKRER